MQGFVREFLETRYAPLAREGVEIYSEAEGTDLFHPYCIGDDFRTAFDPSFGDFELVAGQDSWGAWDAACDVRTEGVKAALDGLSKSSAGRHAVDMALQGYLEEQAWLLVGLGKIQPFLLACLAAE